MSSMKVIQYQNGREEKYSNNNQDYRLIVWRNENEPTHSINSEAINMCFEIFNF